MRTRTALAAAVVAALTLSLAGPTLGPSAAPASAQEPPPHPRPVAGNFVGDAREELFGYMPGPLVEVLASFSKDGTSVTTTLTDFSVNGIYEPIAANVDGDAYDEIIWYAPGRAPDYLWNFTSATASVSTRLTINGIYQPVAGDFTGDGTDDIFWYGQGAEPDNLWDFDATGAHTSTALPVHGTYVAVAGSFGADDTDDVFFYNQTLAGPDYLWDFTKGTTDHVDRAYAVNGSYAPFALDARGDGYGGTDLFWYGYGTRADHRWDFAGGRRVADVADPVNGEYEPIVVADLFADGSDDVLWFRDIAIWGARTINLWDHHVDGTTLTRDRYTLDERAWTAF